MTMPPCLLNHITRERLEKIVETVCAEYGVDRNEVFSGARPSVIVEARHVAMFVSPGSTVWLGQQFGRDHSSVVHARRKIRDWCDVYPDFKAKIEKLKEKIQQA